MNLKYKLYCQLVNRNPAIKERYEGYTVSNAKIHRRFRIVSWGYLVWLNLVSPFIRCRDLSETKPLRGCESSELSVAEYADKLCRADVVSFDVFDTLIFRPFSTPADLFYIIGQKLGHPDFRNIRIIAERKAREDDVENGGKGEININDIYRVIHFMTGLEADKGIKAETEAELSLCFANPFMLKVWDEIKRRGKTIIVTSDMYMPSEFISALLEKNGFIGADRIFVSCEQGCGKFSGKLFDIVKKEYAGRTVSHIGDNYEADYSAASSKGLIPTHYKNADVTGSFYRTFDMSYLIGSAYRGVVNKRLYCGNEAYSLQYEYGYKYGGIFILGFCRFIKKIFTEKKADKVLFFSRDGYIIKNVYQLLYPEDKTEYVYWSRNAAALLSFDTMPYDYYRRFIYQKASQGITVSEALSSMGIPADIIGVKAEMKLTADNADDIVSAVEKNREKVIELYSEMNTAARMYFSGVLDGCDRVITVDCGWAGTGNILLDAYVNGKWDIDCEITGVLGGGNGLRQSDSDFSETYFAEGKLLSYCFSANTNRDLYKSHIPSSKHNIYFEMLLGASEPSFRGFSLDNGKPAFIFDDECENCDTVKEIHRGELDFVNDYIKAFGGYDYMLDISGRDAYAPFASIIAGRGKYPALVLENCVFDEFTAGKKKKI